MATYSFFCPVHIIQVTSYIEECPFCNPQAYCEFPKPEPIDLSHYSIGQKYWYLGDQEVEVVKICKKTIKVQYHTGYKIRTRYVDPTHLLPEETAYVM